MSRPLARLVLLLIAFILLGTVCSLPRAFPPPNPTALPPPETPTETVNTCAFVWASQDLTQLSEQLLKQLKEAELPVRVARASAYGENCVFGDGRIERFVARQTDFYITLEIDTLNNPITLGKLLEQTLDVIDGLPLDKILGSNPGQIGITFRAGDTEDNLWFERTRAKTLREQGLSGAALYQALKEK
ncbi:MAG: hypothetical protein DDG60_00130 [Anaerolineae bacterium]|nr:MAG: hypothetical protein DDG60_00130 [Anaerolineae bacterium]